MRSRVVLSIDFEMRWGMRHILGFNINAYRKNLENVKDIVPKILRLFKERGVRATWACVGALGCDNWEEFFARLPKQPSYTRKELAIGPKYADLDPQGKLHFAPFLIKEILKTPGQDLGCHTFTHMWVRDPGVSEQHFLEDLKGCSRLFEEKFGVTPISFVFPNNEIRFLDVLKNSGIKVLRVSECPNSGVHAAQVPIQTRIGRYLHSINPRANIAHCLDYYDGLYLTKGTFLRFKLGKMPQYLRIKKQVKRLKSQTFIHLWFHPHNIGSCSNKNLAFLKRVLETFEEHKLDICNMADLLAICTKVARHANG